MKKVRPDGNCLVRVTCAHCEEQFEHYAVANIKLLCPACEQVADWMAAEHAKTKELEESTVKLEFDYEINWAPLVGMLLIGVVALGVVFGMGWLFR